MKTIWISTGEPDCKKYGNCLLARDALSKHGKELFNKKFHIMTRWDDKTTHILMCLSQSFNGFLTICFDKSDSMYNQHLELYKMFNPNTKFITRKDFDNLSDLRKFLSNSSAVIVIGGGNEVRADSIHYPDLVFSIASTCGAAESMFQTFQKTQIPDKQMIEAGSYTVLAKQICNLL